MAIFTNPITRVGDSNFRVGSGYKLYFYDAGTTNARDTYTDNTYATPLANPVVADGNGRFSVIWTSGDYKVRLTDADDVLVWEVDNYSTDAGSAVFAESIQSAAGSAADVITANLSTAPSTLTNSLQVVVELAHAANTIGNPTFNLNSLGAVKIVRDNNKPLRAGDTGGSGYKLYLAYSTTLTAWVLLNPAKPSVGLGNKWVNGLAVTNGTDAEHDIDIAVGQILDDTEVMTLDLKSAITKRIDATFATGTGNGGFSDDGDALSPPSLANTTWYGVFLIGKVDGTTDVIFATTRANALADTVAAAAGFIYARLIGYAYTDGSANIVPFVDGGQDSKMFDVGANATSSASTGGIAITCQVPPFQRGIFLYKLGESGTTLKEGVLTQTDQTNTAPSGAAAAIGVRGDGANIIQSTSIFELKVDSSSQIRHREEVSIDSVTVDVLGYNIDYSITDLV